MLHFVSPHPPFEGVKQTVVSSQTTTATLSTRYRNCCKSKPSPSSPPQEMKDGMYSHYFLVSKKMGGMRLILDQ